MEILACFIVGFVFGSIPCGLWIVKAFHHIDIREYGSKNIGTTNVFRTVGWKTAVWVLVFDMLKGILPLMLVDNFSGSTILVAATALWALLGHNYSLFVGFKGGKGVATGLGLLLYLMPVGALAGFLVWAILVFVTRYVSLGSIIAAVVAPVTAFFYGYPTPYVIFGAIAGLFVIVSHNENIGRLISVTESKIKPGNAKDLEKK